jgi:hypothetical protein
MSKNAIKNTLTNRGFARGEFLDERGNSCSIQESSSGVNIWLGCNEIGLKTFVPYGEGWRERSEEDIRAAIKEKFGVSVTDILANTRMHLNQKQARKLIPLLQNFVKTGWLYPPRQRKPKAKAEQPALVIGVND